VSWSVATGTLSAATGTYQDGFIGGSGPRVVSAWSAPAQVTTPTTPGVFAWEMPTAAAMAASPRKVVAYFHTFTAWDRSEGEYDEWLLPSSGSSYGGKWRQRPYPFVGTATTNADRIAKAKDDIAFAHAIGIDAFTYNILTSYMGGSEWDTRVLPYWDAAHEYSQENPSTPFKMLPNPSMLSWSNNAVSATRGANGIRELLAHPAAFKIGGKPVVQFYNVDNFQPQYYRDLHAALLAGTPSIDAVFIASHQSGSPTTGSISMDQFLPLFREGLFIALHPWHSYTHTTSAASTYSEWRTWCRANNVPFMSAAGPRWENDRPDNTGAPKHTEGKGLTILMNSWQSAINNNDPYFQITSWSDHLESHNIRPSTGYQYVPYDVTAFYLAWYKTGVKPTIARDAIYYCHRMHKYRKADGTTLEMSATHQTAGAYNVLGGTPLDQVIVHAFLTAPADIVITVSGVDHVTSITTPGSGVYTATAPMGGAGDTPKFRIMRNGQSVVPQFSSAFTTRSGILWQDLVYRMGSSTRQPIKHNGVVVVQNNLPQDRD
jgi:hypothetical protein